MHSVGLGTDLPKQTTTKQFLCPPQALKIVTRPTKQTKSPDNSNTLNTFINNITYTNFKEAYKYVKAAMVLEEFYLRIILITNSSDHRSVHTK